MKIRTIRFLLAFALASFVVAASVATAPDRGYAQTGTQTFPETGKTVRGTFLDYWKGHGGLTQQGLPISNEMQEKSDTNGKTYTVQYFERAVFELHSENAAPNNVLLSLLGNFLYKQKYPNSAPGQAANSSAGAMLFSATGKHIGGTFLDYWKSHGGLSQQGYPISEEFQEKSDLDGKTYRVQYFERAVFEMHPENKPPYDVLLSQLGTFRYRQNYSGSASAPPASTPQAAGMSVNIVNYNFVPENITVGVGTKITWTNKDASPHTVADITHAIFSSEILHTGETFSYTAMTPGTIHYMCTLHPLMKGTITVK